MATKTYDYGALADALVSMGAITDMATDDKGWKQLALMIADLGEDGYKVFDTISASASNYDAVQTRQIYHWALRHFDAGKVSIGTFLYLCKEAGIDISQYATYSDHALRPLSDGHSIRNGHVSHKSYQAEPLPDQVVQYAIPDWCLISMIPESYDGCPLFRYLCTRFDAAAVDSAFRKYRVGLTRKVIPIGQHSFFPVGSCIFPQIDQWGHLRTAQIMAFDNEAGHFGHRTKDVVTGKSRIHWMHSLLLKSLLHWTAGQWGRIDYLDRKPYFCISGAHLLGCSEDVGKPVFIVESMSTALCMSCAMPDVLWLATAGSSGIRLLADAYQRDAPLLSERDVFLLPDNGKYAVWQQAITSYQLSDVRIVDVMESYPVYGADIKDVMMSSPADFNFFSV